MFKFNIIHLMVCQLVVALYCGAINYAWQTHWSRDVVIETKFIQEYNHTTNESILRKEQNISAVYISYRPLWISYLGFPSYYEKSRLDISTWRVHERDDDDDIIWLIDNAWKFTRSDEFFQAVDEKLYWRKVYNSRVGKPL